MYTFLGYSLVSAPYSANGDNKTKCSNPVVIIVYYKLVNMTKWKLYSYIVTYALQYNKYNK